MPDIAFAEAFAKYGAKLRNIQWSVCAETIDGSLAVSVWEHHFEKPKDGRILCRGHFSRWCGPGNAEFRDKVASAFKTGQELKVVIAHTTDTAAIEAGADASKVKKIFSIKPEWKGRVKSIDGDEYIFEFVRR